MLSTRIAYGTLTIGSTQAAWLEDVNGVGQIVVADLATGRTVQITSGSERARLLGFSGNAVMTLDEDKHVVLKKVNFDAVSSVENQLHGPVSDSDLLPGAQVSISAAGGEMASENGEFRLSISNGGVANTIDWTLYRRDPATSTMAQSLRPGMSVTGYIWEWHSEGLPSENAKLTIALDANLPEEEKARAGIYRWNEQTGSWEMIRTGIYRDNSKISVNTRTPGSYAVMVNNFTFADTDRHWAREAIEQIASQGIASGKSDRQFHPNDPLTRAEFTKMLVETAGLEMKAPSQFHFTDANSKHWANKWIETALHDGLIKTDDPLFYPDKPITREEMMMMLVRALKLSSDADATVDDLQELNAFQDVDKISAEAKESAAIAVKTGLLSGSGGYIKPQGLATRAEAAVFLTRLMAMTNK